MLKSFRILRCLAPLGIFLVLMACGNIPDPRSGIGTNHGTEPGGGTPGNWTVACDQRDRSVCFNYRGTLTALQICPGGTFMQQVASCPVLGCVAVCQTSALASPEVFLYHYYSPTTVQAARTICSTFSGAVFTEGCAQ